ncbi:hypothetical protein [Bradyrhizobium diazoefficiens]|uniref:hypothetical protein n=1 Tax=Bradyrhizobium diazoefficiens TaxID=1355477 RepID=UPI001FD0FABA|nr:hypothetical protein [Bradyrhizobium diazoefficiens]
MSRVTIRQAVELLSADGVIEARQARSRRGAEGPLAQGRNYAVGSRRYVPRHFAGDRQHLGEAQRRAGVSRGRQRPTSCAGFIRHSVRRTAAETGRHAISCVTWHKSSQA